MDDDIITALEEQQAELSGLLRGLDEQGWERPSRCEGWSVADVVLHVAQTNEMAIGSVRDRFIEATLELSDGIAPAADIDAGADLMVQRDRAMGHEAIHQRYLDGARELAALFRESDPHKRVTWVAGELTIRTLTTTRLAETWIHTGDVADGLGVTLPPNDRIRHIARLAWRTLPYAFTRDGRTLTGPVAFELTGPKGDAWDFIPDEPIVTTIRGAASELVQVAARRLEGKASALTGEGPDVDAVLELVRTYA